MTRCAPTRRAVMTRPAAWLQTLFAVVAALALSAPAHAAQDEQQRSDGRIVVSGTVTDRSTGTPLSGVYIRIESLDLLAFSDQNGRFRTRAISPGTWTVEAGQLGYRLWTETRAVAADAATIDIRLEPDPIMLESIQVVSDRIKRRRNAATVSVRAFEGQQLSGAASFDAGDFLRSRLMMTSCPISVFSYGSACVFRRGQLVEPRVYIDEIPLIGGFDFLGMYSTNELYLIEVYDWGSQIRVYTKAFAERLAMGKERIWPVIW